VAKSAIEKSFRGLYIDGLILRIRAPYTGFGCGVKDQVPALGRREGLPRIAEIDPENLDAKIAQFRSVTPCRGRNLTESSRDECSHKGVSQKSLTAGDEYP